MVLECPGSDDVVVYDCGQKGPTETDLGEDEVRDYFDRTIGDDAPTVILSHADSDHVNLVSRVLGNRRPESVWFGGRLADYRGEIASWLKKQDDAGVPIHYGWRRGFGGRGNPVDALQCGDAVGYILAVNTEPGTNPSSLMVLYEHGGFSIVLSGDAEGPAEEKAIANHGGRLSGVTVVMASHHGSRTHNSNHSKWVSHLDPSVVVYSSGVLYGHPKGDVVGRYSKTIVDADGHDMWEDPRTDEEERYSTSESEYVTELDGTIVVESDGERFSLSCSRDDAC